MFKMRKQLLHKGAQSRQTEILMQRLLEGNLCKLKIKTPRNEPFRYIFAQLRYLGACL
jgi:hypothetical protein